jgi:hypothetical protein
MFKHSNVGRFEIRQLYLFLAKQDFQHSLE